jgi:hypothetical protein
VWLDLPRYLMRHPILRLPENQTGRGGDLGLIALAIPRRKRWLSCGGFQGDLPGGHGRGTSDARTGGRPFTVSRQAAWKRFG